MAKRAPLPKLLVPRLEAAQKIHEQIQVGFNIRNMLIQSPNQLDEASSARRRWEDYNVLSLNKLFDGPSLAEEFEGYAGTITMTDSFPRRVELFREWTDGYITILESILGRLDLIDELDEQPTPTIDIGDTEGRRDAAQICLNGHIINQFLGLEPQYNKEFCDTCGAETITSCHDCNLRIRGGYFNGAYIAEYSDAPPSFCEGCGEPFPWTKTTMEAAKELADELDALSAEDRDALKKSLDDIVRDTPHATVAATRFKKLVAKAGKGTAESFKVILVDIISETARKMIWP